MDILCINDTYPRDTLDFWGKHGVTYPKKDDKVTLRSQQLHTNGKIGIRVYEHLNPEIPIKHPVLGIIQVEVSFSILRFSTTEGLVLTKEILEEYFSTTTV
jgi:hypothetical protein